MIAELTTTHTRTESMRRIMRIVCIGALITAFAMPASAREQRGEQLVFAAASLTDVLEEIGSAYGSKTQQVIGFSFAASSILARQIEAGAAADVFISADEEWMDYLESRGHLQSGSRVNVAGNELVLIAAADSTIQLRIAPEFSLANALGRWRLATGDPDIVPAGRYARAALKTMGVWDDVERRLVGAESVRTALAFVARGEVPLGIVYRTDALVENRVRIVDTFPEGSHPKIVYPAAVVKGAKPGASEFVAYLRSSKEAQRIFLRHGFRVQRVSIP
jgi:molybdate transport system substrate-binding protein